MDWWDSMEIDYNNEMAKDEDSPEEQEDFFDKADRLYEQKRDEKYEKDN